MELSLSFSNGKFNLETKKSSRPQRKKGKSLLLLPKDYTLIDLETTGLDPHWDDIIEVACIKYRSGQEYASYHSLIQPPTDEDGHYVDPFITDLTGITNEMLTMAPKFEEAADDIWFFLKDELLVGHNINFDINFLYDKFQYIGDRLLKNDFIDTLRLARRVLPDLQHHRLRDLNKYFSIGNAEHRALDDCKTTNIILQKLANIISEKQIDLSLWNMPHASFDLRSLTGNEANFLTDHPFYDMHCVFTGKLERFTRKDAAQLVANIGGHCDNNVTKHTNFLIVGDLDYSTSIKCGKSGKLKKAEQLILEGQDLKVITENVFYDMLVDSTQTAVK